ncbi:unnamed protein product [Amoebophrya sp. A25]|nr:unnamed protein product [Amoebophrya sp. A25]|eukprot:GSA25T00006665001.1
MLLVAKVKMLLSPCRCLVLVVVRSRAVLRSRGLRRATQPRRKKPLLNARKQLQPPRPLPARSRRPSRTSRRPWPRSRRRLGETKRNSESHSRLGVSVDEENEENVNESFDFIFIGKYYYMLQTTPSNQISSEEKRRNIDRRDFHFFLVRENKKV